MKNYSFFTNYSLLSFATNFFIVIYAIITLVDLLLKFRKPWTVKLIFSLLVLSIGISNLFQLFELNYYQNKVANFCIKTIFTIAFLQLLTNLFFPHFKKFVNILCLSILVFASISITAVVINNYPSLSQSKIVYYNEISPYNDGIKVPIIIDIFRLIFSILYIGIILYFCFQIIINFNHNNLYFKRVKNFTYAIVIYIMLLLIFFVSRQFFFLKHPILNISIAFSLDLLILLIIYNRPEFLNRSSMKMNLIHRFIPIKKFDIDSVNFNALFFNQMYFLDKEAKIEQFSKLMNVSKDEVNNFVQNEYGLDFDDLLNRNRVDYFIKLVKEPKYQNMTIDALAKESGFVSRNAFYKPFKKFHGGNPSDLIDFNS
jgi:hypothetical protein